MGYFTQMSAGGGLLDDVEVLFTNARFLNYAYGGKAMPSPGLVVDFIGHGDTVIPDDQGEQFWSCGSGKDWQPSADGKRLDSPSNKAGIVQTSNLGMLVDSLMKAGLSNALLSKAETDISALNGLVVHVKRIQIDRKMSNPKRDAQGNVQLPTVLLVDRLIQEPGGKAAAGSKPSGSAGAPATGGAADAAVAAVMTFAAENGGYRKSDAVKVFKAMQSDPDAKQFAAEAFKLLANEEFLANGPWTYAGGVVTV